MATTNCSAYFCASSSFPLFSFPCVILLSAELFTLDSLAKIKTKQTKPLQSHLKTQFKPQSRKKNNPKDQICGYLILQDARWEQLTGTQAAVSTRSCQKYQRKKSSNNFRQ